MAADQVKNPFQETSQQYSRQVIKIHDEDAKRIGFLKSVQPGSEVVFGIKSKARDLEPSMKQLFTWGYEADVRQDYTKNTPAISNKIRKMKRVYISESHDNFRKPECTDGDQMLFNYCDYEDELQLLKSKICKLAAETESYKVQSAYQESFKEDILKNLWKEVQEWTAAGKPVLKEKSKTLKMPIHYMREKIEQTLLKAGFKRDVANDCSQSFFQQQDQINDQNQHDEHQKQNPAHDKNIHTTPKGKSKQTLSDIENLAAKTEALWAQGRLMPDTAITTYFGKPTFHSYGRVNVQPANGGLVYGDYMKSHNINPHSGDNHPKTIQGYENALRGRLDLMSTPVVDAKKDEQLPAMLLKARKMREPQPPRSITKARPQSADQKQHQSEIFDIMPKKAQPTHHFQIKKPKLDTQTADVQSKNQSTDIGRPPKPTIQKQKLTETKKPSTFDLKSGSALQKQGSQRSLLQKPIAQSTIKKTQSLTSFKEY